LQSGLLLGINSLLGICQGVFRLSGAQSDIQKFATFLDLGTKGEFNSIKS
jgi:hypothetical protein